MPPLLAMAPELLAAGGGAGAAAGGGAGGLGSLAGMMGGGGGKSGGGGMAGPVSPQALMGVATGALQSIQAARLKKKAENSLPQEIDPRQSAYLSELAQKRKAMDTGSAFATGMSAVDTGQAGTNAALVKATGGDVGGTVQALLQAQRGADIAKGNVLAQGQQQRMGYDQMYGDLMNKISARQLQLQMYNSQQARAEWAQKKQTASQNMMAGLGKLAGTEMPKTTPAVGATPSTAGMDPSMSYLGATASNITNPAPVNNVTMDPNQTKDMPVTSGTNLLGEGQGFELKK